MNSYQTQITLDNSQQILLSNLPFKEGTKLNINIEVVEEDIKFERNGHEKIDRFLYSD